MAGSTCSGGEEQHLQAVDEAVLVDALDGPHELHAGRQIGRRRGVRHAAQQDQASQYGPQDWKDHVANSFTKPTHGRGAAERPILPSQAVGSRIAPAVVQRVLWLDSADPTQPSSFGRTWGLVE